MNTSNYISKIKESPKYKTIIALPNGGIVTAYLKNDMSFDISSDYTSPFELSQASGISDMVEKASNLFGKSFTLKTVDESKLLWKSSQIGSLQLTFTILALNPNDDVRADVRKLAHAVFPTASGVGGTLQAPLKYASGTPGSYPVNTISIKIGKWFRASHLVMRSLNPVFSKEVIGSGLPLYCDVSVVFEPALQLTIEDFLSWLS